VYRIGNVKMRCMDDALFRNINNSRKSIAKAYFFPFLLLTSVKRLILGVAEELALLAVSPVNVLFIVVEFLFVEYWPFSMRNLPIF